MVQINGLVGHRSNLIWMNDLVLELFKHIKLNQDITLRYGTSLRGDSVRGLTIVELIGQRLWQKCLTEQWVLTLIPWITESIVVLS